MAAQKIALKKANVVTGLRHWRGRQWRHGIDARHAVLLAEAVKTVLLVDALRGAAVKGGPRLDLPVWRKLVRVWTVHFKVETN